MFVVNFDTLANTNKSRCYLMLTMATTTFDLGALVTHVSGYASHFLLELLQEVRNRLCIRASAGCTAVYGDVSIVMVMLLYGCLPMWVVKFFALCALVSEVIVGRLT